MIDVRELCEILHMDPTHPSLPTNTKGRMTVLRVNTANTSVIPHVAECTWRDDSRGGFKNKIRRKNGKIPVIARF